MSNITCHHLAHITNEILCNGVKYCIQEGEKVHCNNEVFEIPESPLDYHDKMFWIYLGVYVGLVLFAGKLSQYFHKFCIVILLCICSNNMFSISIINTH